MKETKPKAEPRRRTALDLGGNEAHALKLGGKKSTMQI